MEIKKQMELRRMIFAFLAVIWMSFIFYMSAQEAEESAEMSGSIGHMIGHYLVKGFDDMPIEEQNAYAESIEFPIRKGAHMTEYAIFSMLLMGVFYPGHLAIWKCMMIGTLYAASDEFHQLFVPGRAGLVVDVFIDMAGLLIGIGVVLAVIHIRNRRK